MSFKKKLAKDMMIRNELVPKPQIVAEVYCRRDHPWSRIGAEIVEIESACFPDDERFSDAELRDFFDDPNNVVVLLWDCREVIGFSIARPVSKIWPKRAEEMDTYNITTTDIHTEYQGRGYVGLLMTMLEKELKAGGARYIERNAKVGNGYAEAVAKYYAGRIVQSGEPRNTKYGELQFFRIALAV